MSTLAGRSSTLAASVMAALNDVLRTPAPLHQPVFHGNEWRYVKDCIDTGWVSSVGAYVERFEEMLVAATGARYATATVNGTAALHTCLMLAGVGAGDEVIAPSLTFVATANAIAHCGAIPHFADSDMATLGLDAAKLGRHLDEIGARRPEGCFNAKTGRRIAAVVVTHIFGHPAELDSLRALCDRWSLPLIEDAAESLGSFYNGRHTGTTGLLGALSFNGNKTVTTGGGGAVLTNDPQLASVARHLTTTAKLPHKWAYRHDRVGYNYRLPNINAALGCAQLEQLPAFLDTKRALATAYREVLANMPGLRFVDEPDGCRSNFWLNAICLDMQHEDQRDVILDMTNAAGFMTRPAWDPLHTLPMYQDAPRAELDAAEALCRRLVNLPSGAGLERA